MTRDETIALFLECEGKRRDARAAALAEGKAADEAGSIAHEAAKAHWNAWAEPLLAERKAMEANGRWAAEKKSWGSLEPKNAETSAWMEKAAAAFSRCLFLSRGVEGTKEAAGEEQEDTGGEAPVKSIPLEGSGANFSGFIFPGDAWFGSATFTGDAELVAKYRAIRRMAIQGADYEREQRAFKGELRARRLTVDKWWHLGTWFGLVYDLLADCGRSIVRPVLLWCGSVVAFAMVYTRLADQGGEAWSRCVAQGATPAVKALFLSGRNALVLFGGGRDARISQAYQCLYGGAPEPQIPDSVSFLEAFVQVPLSAVLIFLLLLAIKNRFKIK